MPLDEGDLFAGRYRVVRCIASGGMGAVYEAVHTHTERRCAIKVMLGHTVEREKLRQRFIQESKVAAQIGSEYIVDILDAGVDEKTKSPFLVMELLDGEDLAQRLARVGRFSPEEATTYLWHAALALDRTHRSSIVHRDLKASNLFLTHREDGTPVVKVLDFGVAKVMPTEATSEGATQTVGTPIYMAPEQFRADGRISAATDIYALGMLAYTLLVGAHYWKDEHDRCENPFAFASIAVNGPTEPPSARAARHGVTLPRAFDDWFTIATSKMPSARYQSATQAVIELASALGVLLPPAVPVRAAAAAKSGTLSAHSSGARAVVPATLESSSAPVSGLQRPAHPSSSPELSFHHSQPSFPLSDASGDVARERTEVSLSVTSGGLEASELQAPPRRSRRLVYATLGLALVAAGTFGLREKLFEEAPSPATAPTSPTITKAEQSAQAKPSTGETQAPPQPNDVVTMEQLPPATSEVEATDPRTLPRDVPPTPVQPARRKQSASSKPSQRPATQSATSTRPSVAETEAPKAVDPLELYKRP